MVAEVIVDISISETDKVFEYAIPDATSYSVGDRVSIPFGKKVKEGIIIKIKEVADYKSELKSIIARLDSFTAILPEMIELSSFMVKKFHVRICDTLRLFIPSEMRGGRVGEKNRLFVSIVKSIPIEEMLEGITSRSPQQKRLLLELSQKEGEWKSVLMESYSQSSISALVDKGYISIYEKRVARTPNYGRLRNDVFEMNSEQEAACHEILEGKDSVFLLHGVTGSGKTEVYIRCIKEMLRQGKTAIMLVPEISLTPLMMSRLRSRFGGSVALLHSGLSSGERYDEWTRLRSGEARIAIGARSAVFAPLQNLGLIVLDEEHDSSYVSERNPRYFTHDIARFRASYNGAKIVLGSATPDIGTYHDAMTGKIHLLELKERANHCLMPQMNMVNMCNEVIAGNTSIFSRALREALHRTLEEGNQAMLYINRRGFASFMMCKKCGYVYKCEHCDVSLTYHSEDNMLKCHYCGDRYTVPTVCSNCGDGNIRMGRIGTERVVKELKQLFPKVRTLRMDNDTTRTKESYYKILDAFEEKEADVLVGTQMIAKGHDFKDVTLVGVLDADLSLYLEDFRSSERTFQLITQVAGRAGRADKVGEVIVQSYSPQHYVFRYAAQYDYIGFYKKEANLREVSNYPPFSKIVRVLFSSENESAVYEATRETVLKMRLLEQEYVDQFIYLQAMKSPIKKIENKLRCQILVRIKREKEEELLDRIYSICDEKKTKGVSCFVEINPQNLN